MTDFQSTGQTMLPAPQPARVPRNLAQMVRAAAGFLSAGLLCVGGLSVIAPQAWAHDSLISSSPEQDEILQETPEEIHLEFSGDGLLSGETITNKILVRDVNGENWEGETVVEGSTMFTELPEELPNGEFSVIFRVVYSDGHDEERAFSFEVADPESEEQITEETPHEEASTQEADAQAEDGAQTGSGSESNASSEGLSRTGIWVLSSIVGLILVASATWMFLARQRAQANRRTDQDAPQSDAGAL